MTIAKAAEPVLAVEGIVAGYGGGDIVKNVSLSIAEREIAVLLGPNGAGKSTLLKAIMGLVTRSAGRVVLRGTDVSQWITERLSTGGMAYVPQLRNVFPALTVVENLEMGGYSMRSGVRARAAEMLDLFPNLRAANRRPASTLSGGERNMLALARGLMPGPAVLLVDEPTAGLSPQYEEVVWSQLELIRTTGVAILVVEQNVATALEHADTAYVLVLGQTRLRGPAEDLRGSADLTSLYIGGQEAQSPPDPAAKVR
jgi:ABC-type branched-subunit amino acid transport system ATPase component